MTRTYRKPIERAMERVAELARLEHDWDSYGAHPPTPRAISMARAMIERTTKRFDERGGPRDIMPIADGALALEWRSPTLELGLNACPDGGWSYLLVEWIGAERRSVEGYDLSDEEALALISRVITTHGLDDA